MGSTICTAGFPSAAIASSCFTARCDSIWYGFFIATLLFLGKRNCSQPIKGFERGVATFYDLPGILVFSSLKMSWMVSRRAGVLMTWSRIRRGVDRVPSRYRPGPQNRSMYLSLPSRAFVCGRTMFAQPPKYLLTIRCFFNEASVGASKNVASAINVENLGSSRWRRIELYQIQEHFLRSLFSQSEPLRSCDSAHNRSDSRAIPSCHRRTMHHQHILPIVAFSCGGEIEPAYLHGGAIHEHKRVMHDGIVVIDPHRHTLIRQELRRRVSRRGVDLSTTTCTSTPRLPPITAPPPTSPASS